MNSYAPCPKCGSTGAERMKFTWWGGVIGPRILSHVKCPGCGNAYNGKTGRENTTGIVVYSAIVAILVFGLVMVLFVAAGLMMTLAR
jgi:predicted nucleic-acid-binding Zn-ribbon protein